MRLRKPLTRAGGDFKTYSPDHTTEPVQVEEVQEVGDTKKTQREPYAEIGVNSMSASNHPVGA